MNDYSREYFKKELGQLIVNYRKIHNLSRAQLAELMNISDNGLARIETGDNEARIYNALKLMYLLKIKHNSVNDLFLKYAKKEIDEQIATSKIKVESRVNHQMNAKTYRITGDTLAIKPNYDAKYQSKIIEVNQNFFIEQTPLEIIKHNALINGASYEGRRESIKYLLGFEQKIPIPINIEKNIYLFPTTSPLDMECVWVCSEAVAEIKSVEGEEDKGIKSRIHFKSGIILDLKESIYSLRKQTERVGMCKIVMAQR